MQNIQIVPLSKMKEMRRYFNEYLTELSEFDPDIKFDDNGKPIYNWFDCYWTDKDRFPFYFLVDNQIAGLALIRELGNMLYNLQNFMSVLNFEKMAMLCGFYKLHCHGGVIK